jgi:hypothetical protein
MEEKDRAELVRKQALSIKGEIDTATDRKAVESGIAKLYNLLSDPNLPARVASFIKGLITAAEEKSKSASAGERPNLLSPAINKSLAGFKRAVAQFDKAAKSYAALLDEAKKKEEEFNRLIHEIMQDPFSDDAKQKRGEMVENLVDRVSLAPGAGECIAAVEKMQEAKKAIEDDKSLGQEQKDRLLDQANAEIKSAQAKLAALNSLDQELRKQLVVDIEKAVLDIAAAAKSSSMAEYKQIVSNGLSEAQKKEITTFVEQCQGMPKDLIMEKYKNLEEKIIGIKAAKVEEVAKGEWVGKGSEKVGEKVLDELGDIFATELPSKTSSHAEAVVKSRKNNNIPSR